MTMPGPNALYWPQSENQQYRQYRKLRIYTFQVTERWLCYSSVLLLCSLAKAFKRVNPVSPIDLRLFGEKLPYLGIGILSRKEH